MGGKKRVFFSRTLLELLDGVVKDSVVFICRSREGNTLITFKISFITIRCILIIEHLVNTISKRKKYSPRTLLFIIVYILDNNHNSNNNHYVLLSMCQTLYQCLILISFPVFLGNFSLYSHTYSFIHLSINIAYWLLFDNLAHSRCSTNIS